MGEAIGQSLPVAVGILVSPMPLVALVLLLVSRRAHSNGLTFVLGWMASIFVLGALTILLTAASATNTHHETSSWASALKIVLGVLLLALGVRGWRRRPRDGAEPAPSSWMTAVDKFTPVKALGVGAFFGAVNPKNLLLVISGATDISTASATGSDRILALAVFTLVASLGVLAIFGIYLAMGDQSAALLGTIKRWMIANNAVVMAVLFLILGVKVVGSGLSGL